MRVKPLASALLLGLAPGDDGAAPVPFLVEETLAFPTATSVSFTAVPAVDARLYVAYGPADGSLAARTLVADVPAGEAGRFLLDGLRPGSSYVYRLHCAPAGSERFEARDAHGFATLPEPGSPFTFVYGADSHYYEMWAEDTFSGSDRLATFHLALQHVLADAPLFHVIGGDFAMTSCKGCKGGTFEGAQYPAGSIVDVAGARQRYLRTFAPDAFGQVHKSVPFVHVLGNHEGEAGFDPLELAASMAARRAILPDVPAALDPDRAHAHYAFDAGDARFIVLDVMRHTEKKPQTADDWTLGVPQLRWLQRQLRDNPHPWVFVLAEHLVGGEKAFGVGQNESWYGRGGLRATLDDDPSGTFKGEQAIVQALEEAYRPEGGAVFFLCGHDHVAVTPTEKPGVDGRGTGTWLLKGGRMSGVSFGWSTDLGFQKELDQDLDGVADYLEPELGSTSAGYFRITVDGPSSVTFEYVRANKNDPALDGTVAFSRTIVAGGG